MSTELRKTPWSAYSGEDTNGWFVIHDAGGDEIGSTDGGFEEAEARMFAAAPDMRDALKEARDCVLACLNAEESANYPNLASCEYFRMLLKQTDAALARAGIA